MKKLVTFSLLALIAIGGGVVVVKKTAPSNQTSESTQKNDVASGPSVPLSVVLSPQEVAKHNSAQSCWLIVSNKVYDVTNSIDQHPGSAQAILSNCGKESTEAFSTRGKPDGKPHSATAKSFLEQLYIGDLNQTISVDPSNSTTSNAPSQTGTGQNRYRGGDDDEFDDD